ncbi:CreD [Verticillium alfalfae VaMs.102]|uniref:CreD n=1 Tax=Verticillium alfalfae (strain VaMs.102 / ATCC MYA-4576 / FGSC 10136) TaxID=526221 RepID=C9SRL2_VERA1|nr:CreD [Verticillium alfalfae VaMs.102]EEY21427.1 CreD [Verticillium alfalfae VaMs.102]
MRRLYQDFVCFTALESSAQQVTSQPSAGLLPNSPQSDFVILSGSEREAPGQYIRGKVTLCLPSAQRARGVQLQLVGYHRTSWLVYRTQAADMAFSDHDSDLHSASSTTGVVYQHIWAPFLIDDVPSASLGGPLPKGTYEWPFEHLIPGHVPETARGCPRCSITYHLKASTVRDAPDETSPQAMKPIRIIRTLPSSAFALMDAATVEGTSTGRLVYSLSLAHKAIALGTVLPVDLRFTALAKNITLRSVRCLLREVHSLETQVASGCPGAGTTTSTVEGYRLAAAWDLAMDDKGRIGRFDGAAGEWHVQRRLPMPTTLIKCSPDVDVRGIKVSHQVEFAVTFAEGPDMISNRADWCSSEPQSPSSSTSLPTPPSRARTTSSRGAPTSTSAPPAPLNSSMEVPPCYGRHKLGRACSRTTRPSLVFAALRSRRAGL